jgi:trk system potassium uptake protein TrkA
MMACLYIISKASRDIQAKFLLRNGADEVVYPDKDMAEKLAVRCSMNKILDYFEVSDDYSIFEIPVFESWIGHSIEEKNIRTKYHINILIIKNGDNIMSMPKADYIFKPEDMILAFGRSEDVIKIANNV